MRKLLFLLLSLSVCVTSFAQQTAGTGRRPAARLGEGAGYSSRDATVLSMMGWGVGLVVGFAAICALIDNSTTTSHSSSSSGH